MTTYLAIGAIYLAIGLLAALLGWLYTISQGGSFAWRDGIIALLGWPYYVALLLWVAWLRVAR